MLDLVALGETVRALRGERGYDETALAQGAHVAEAKVRQFERAGAPISTAELGRIASFLQVDVDRLVRGQWMPAARFRQLGATTDFHWDDKIHLERALASAWDVHDLSRALGIENVLRDQAAPVSGTPYLHGYSLARAVRTKLGFNDLEIVNLQAVLEDQLGIPIVAAALRSSRIAAITVKAPAETGLVAAVIVNATIGRGRHPSLVQVDLAHELAHVLFDPVGADIEAWFDRESDGASDGDADRHEQRARAFAAEFLIPNSGARQLLGQPHKEIDPAVAADMVVAVCTKLRSPPALTAYHLKNHDYIDATARSAATAAAKVRVLEEPAVTLEPRLLERLADRANATGVITDARWRALLKRSIWD